MYLKIAIAVVLIVLVVATISIIASGAVYRGEPEKVASASLAPDGCHQIEGGIVCYVNGHWQPQCYWGYRAIFLLKKCVIGGVQG